ncbi:hypothetical protein KUCAC02_000376 [Chaenocephalus aceratus]|uniref:Uncharacterized protein n=1 Tax=Chaenocephalus aceratus TaxID=36190 RepID=A0ACB9W765_CHAAC|nr:hypothetical protein KUCAC02_000376 [Chaenocephalus aceratus]
MWLKGPDFLLKTKQKEGDTEPSFDLVNPESDPDIRPPVTSCATRVVESPLDVSHFESFSTWRSLVRTIARLIHIARSFKRERNKSKCQGWHICKGLCPEDLARAKEIIIRSLQCKAFPKVFACIQAGKETPKQSQLTRLSPYLDDAGCLRVGGRLSKADIVSDERNPLIIPHGQHLTTLLIRYYHQQVQHQGRHFTEGADSQVHRNQWPMGMVVKTFPSHNGKFLQQQIYIPCDSLLANISMCLELQSAMFKSLPGSRERSPTYGLN